MTSRSLPDNILLEPKRYIRKCVCVCAQVCPILCDFMDCSLPGSSVHEISWARILEWVAISSSRDLPNPGIELSLLNYSQILYALSHQGSRFVIDGLYYVEVCTLYAHFLKHFIINWCWILSKAYSASIEMIIWLLFFNLLMVVHHIDWFADVEKSLHPWDEATWSWCMIFLIYG